jgi:hypothetical protein
MTTLAFAEAALTTEGLMACMEDGLRIIRVLTAADEVMRYNVWLRLIGAIPATEPWDIRYRPLTSLIPKAIAAVAVLHGEPIARRRGEPGIQFWRIVSRNGEPGLGIADDVLVEA